MTQSMLPTAQALDILQNDEMYYGDFGKQYLSNSDILFLLKNPTQFRVKQEISKPLIEGSYFHTCMLEPERKSEFNIIDVTSRSTKTYKEECPPGEMYLLKKEAEYIDSLVEKMRSNLYMYDYLYAKDNKYEVPAIDTIMGNMWKGKADVVHKEYVIDIKTCSDLDKFQYSSKTWNYDSQAYIYQRMFGKPMLFFVICKQTGRLGVFDCSPDFVKGGQNKVEAATEVFNKFFSDESFEDINSYIHRQTL